MISNSGHDENGKYSGGKAGDQTGKEWAIINWYNRPWKCIIRHPDTKVREMIASLAEKAAKNDKIGYDQGQRVTYWDELVKAKYNPSAIKTKCEADCSSGVMANVKAAGYLLNNAKLKAVSITSTHYMREMLRKAGFEILTESKYLTSDKYLLRGDILLNDTAHTATNLTNGSKISATSINDSKASSGKTSSVKVESAKSFDKSIAGTYIVNTSTEPLMLRSGAGTGKTIVAKMPKGAKIQCYGYYTEVNSVRWYYVVYDGQDGFASSKYLKKK
ncbi:MAG: SH3 domain-containing protein [Roseburia sp.]|nr:SH3 domain-containing protein [Roseburia sp.]